MPSSLFLRHPLQDLPLDTFLPLEHRSSTKRPLSPSATLLSPSKRRILCAEGLHSPGKSRAATFCEPLFPELTDSLPISARKLDFAALSHPIPRKACAKPSRDAFSCPVSPTSTFGDASRLVPSPKISSSSAASGTSYSHRDLTLFRDCDMPTPIVFPGDTPLTIDRQSIHWPGFDVYRDSHDASRNLQSLPPKSDVTLASDTDDEKENTKPRRRMSKKLPSDHKKTVRVGQLEKHCQGIGDVSIMSMLSQTKASTPQERKQKRLLMVREMDQEMDDEDDVDQLL